jgi:hypothetical protein
MSATSCADRGLVTAASNKPAAAVSTSVYVTVWLLSREAVHALLHCHSRCLHTTAQTRNSRLCICPTSRSCMLCSCKFQVSYDCRMLSGPLCVTARCQAGWSGCNAPVCHNNHEKQDQAATPRAQASMRCIEAYKLRYVPFVYLKTRVVVAMGLHCIQIVNDCCPASRRCSDGYCRCRVTAQSSHDDSKQLSKDRACDGGSTLLFSFKRTNVSGDDAPVWPCCWRLH